MTSLASERSETSGFSSCPWSVRLVSCLYLKLIELKLRWSIHDDLYECRRWCDSKQLKITLAQLCVFCLAVPSSVLISFNLLKFNIQINTINEHGIFLHRPKWLVLLVLFPLSTICSSRIGRKGWWVHNNLIPGLFVLLQSTFQKSRLNQHTKYECWLRFPWKSHGYSPDSVMRMFHHDVIRITPRVCNSQGCDGWFASPWWRSSPYQIFTEWNVTICGWFPSYDSALDQTYELSFRWHTSRLFIIMGGNELLLCVRNVSHWMVLWTWVCESESRVYTIIHNGRLCHKRSAFSFYFFPCVSLCVSSPCVPRLVLFLAAAQALLCGNRQEHCPLSAACTHVHVSYAQALFSWGINIHLVCSQMDSWGGYPFTPGILVSRQYSHCVMARIWSLNTY